MAKQAIDEKRTAAASYILNFYNDVSQLTHYYANYENLLVELHQKHGGQEDKLSIEEREVLKQFCQQLRYWATVAYVHYMSISKSVKLKKDKEINKLFEDIKKQYIIKRDDVNKLVIKLNSVLVQDIIKNLLESSQSIVAQLYGENSVNE